MNVVFSFFGGSGLRCVQHSGENSRGTTYYQDTCHKRGRSGQRDTGSQLDHDNDLKY